MMLPSQKRTIEVFVSYAQKDKWLRDELEKHLSTMKQQGIIKAWHDREILAGKEWAGEIDKHLNTAQVILLLVSPDFISSDYCYNVEVKRAMKRHENREAVTIPILLRHVDYDGAPFGKLQPLPQNRVPVTDWGNLDKDLDKAFKSVTEGIRKAIQRLESLEHDPLPLPAETGGDTDSREESTPATVANSPRISQSSTAVQQHQVETPPGTRSKKISRRTLLFACAAVSTPLLAMLVKFIQGTQLSTFDFEVVTVDAQGKRTERNLKTARFFTENLVKDVDLEMVSIPTEKFYMGATDNDYIGKSDTKTEEDDLKYSGPRHLVAISPFFISKYPITQAQWQAVAKLPKVGIDLKPTPSEYFKGADYPVQWISWHEATEFCERLSKKTGRKYRLPSEAEWEYACRGGTDTAYHFGETLTPKLANYDNTPPYDEVPPGQGGTTSVGSFGVANAFGLFDMHGNVCEWCADYWHKDYADAPLDGVAWTIGGKADYRILRGGSWTESMRRCRSAYRTADHVDQKTNYIGFRVACSER